MANLKQRYASLRGLVIGIIAISAFACAILPVHAQQLKKILPLPDETLPNTFSVNISPNGGIVVGLAHGVVGCDLEDGNTPIIWTPDGGTEPLANDFCDYVFFYPTFVSDNKVVILNHGWGFISRWTPTSGFEYFVRPNNKFGTINAVSADFSVVVGNVSTNHNGINIPKAMRWTSLTQHQYLADAYSESDAADISHDGTVVTGWVKESNGFYSVFRWTEAGLEVLGAPEGYQNAVPTAISGDGSTIIGYAYNNTQSHLWRPFRWTNASFEMLVPSSETASFYPTAVSSNGSVVILKREFGLYRERLFRWTHTSGLQEIGVTPFNSRALLSADGSIVVWIGKNLSGQQGLHRWTVCGTDNLTARFNTEFTNEFGEDIDWQWLDGISPDGRFITGTVVIPAAFLGYWLDTGPLCASHNGDVDNNGCVDDADLLTILFQFGQEGQCLGRVDVNCDDTVDDADLLIVLFNFGSGC